MPRQKFDDARVFPVPVKFSRDEKSTITQIAMGLGITRSELLRALALGTPTSHIEPIVKRFKANHP